MPSCVCLRSPNKYVTSPKTPSELKATTTTNTADNQSLVTDSEVFDHQALLNQEGSTTYEGDSRAVSPSNSSDYNYLNNSSDQNSSDNSSDDQSSGSSDQQDYEFSSEKSEDLRKTVEKWNNLLKQFDENPDVQEVQKTLRLVASMSKDELEESDDVKKQVEETIRRLTSSLSEVRSLSSQMSDKELVLQPHMGDDDQTHFKCFLRNVKSHMGEAGLIYIFILIINYLLLFNQS